MTASPSPIGELIAPAVSLTAAVENVDCKTIIPSPLTKKRSFEQTRTNETHAISFPFNPFQREEEEKAKKMQGGEKVTKAFESASNPPVVLPCSNQLKAPSRKAAESVSNPPVVLPCSNQLKEPSRKAADVLVMNVDTGTTSTVNFNATQKRPPSHAEAAAAFSRISKNFKNHRLPTMFNHRPKILPIPASISQAATSQLFCGRRGDPRMHRAVAARLENPDLTLLDALILGGFSFPNGVVSMLSDRGVTDCDGVLLCQRKNQLSRRLRLARKRAAKLLKSAGIDGGDAAAAAVFTNNGSNPSDTSSINSHLLGNHLKPGASGQPSLSELVLQQQKKLQKNPSDSGKDASASDKTSSSEIDLAHWARAALAKEATEASYSISPHQGRKLRQELELQHLYDSLSAPHKPASSLSEQLISLPIPQGNGPNVLASRALRQQVDAAVQHHFHRRMDNNHNHPYLKLATRGGLSPSSVIPNQVTSAAAIRPPSHMRPQNTGMNQNYLNLINRICQQRQNQNDQNNRGDPYHRPRTTRTIVPDVSFSSSVVPEPFPKYKSYSHNKNNQEEVVDSMNSNHDTMLAASTESNVKERKTNGNIDYSPPINGGITSTSTTTNSENSSSKPTSIQQPAITESLTAKLERAAKFYKSERTPMMQKCLIMAGFKDTDVVVVPDKHGGGVLSLFEKQLCQF